VRHELRYRGQSFELAVEEELAADGDAPDGLAPARLQEAFAAEHERRYGYRDAESPVELVNMRVSVWGEAPALEPAGIRREGAPQPPLEVAVHMADGEVAAALHRGEPEPGEELRGPALWALPEATLLVPPGWRGSVDAHGTIHLRRGQGG
jgi:N-methylhydantoinase A